MRKNSSGVIHILLILVVVVAVGVVAIFGKDKLTSIIRVGGPMDNGPLQMPESNKTYTGPIDDGGVEVSKSDWKTYTNSMYKYQINYPPDWTVSEENGVSPTTEEEYRYIWFKSLDGSFSFTFGLKNKSETNLSLSTRTGTPAGDFVEGETIYVGGFNLYTKKIVYNGKTNTVFFSTNDKDEKYEVYGDFTYIGPDLEYMNTTDLLTVGEYQTVKSILSTFKFIQ